MAAENLGVVDHMYALEALKVADIDGQRLRDAMNAHARGEAGVMYLHAFDFMSDEEFPPTIMHFAAVS